MPAPRRSVLIQDHQGRVATMRFIPIVLLLFTVLGCGSKKTESAKPPADSGGNQAQQQKVVTPEKQSAKTPAEKAAVAAVKKHMTPAQLALGDPIVNSVGMLLVPILLVSSRWAARTWISP